jgi:hypothetical protein
VILLHIALSTVPRAYRKVVAGRTDISHNWRIQGWTAQVEERREAERGAATEERSCRKLCVCVCDMCDEYNE